MHFEICGGCGIHWPEIDEDLSTAGLLHGLPAPIAKKIATRKKTTPRKKRAKSSSKP